MPDSSHNSPRSLMHWGVLALVLLNVGLLALTNPTRAISAGFVVEPDLSPRDPSTTPIYESRFVGAGVPAFSHSASMVEISDGRLRAFWMGGGSHEGKSDVAIYTALFDPATNAWTRETPIIQVDDSQRHLHRNIHTVGNATIHKFDSGRLLLWYVSVSVGGWAGSSINMIHSDDDGETWSAPKRLVTSPFFNLSSLVKSPPVRFTDGTIGLPIYHEFMGKFCELLRLTPDGKVLHKQRLTKGRRTLQPAIIPRSETEATAFLRRSDKAPRRAITVATSDGGLSWGEPLILDMPNPGSPISALRLDTGELLIVFNNVPRKRDKLTLAISSDEGVTYDIIKEIESKGDHLSNGFGYPWLMQSSTGQFHLLYTWRRERIKHLTFNRAWLEQNRSSR
ncbi:MAG: exo-alpha-sialidase [Planctomycetota bacterium]|nr:exo-alpha-sialidase [Planctomycetota bacterium]